MKLIERVARGMCRADPDVRRGDADGVIEQSVNRYWHLYADAAKAAIRAVLDGVEPCAWETYHDKPMLFHDHGEAAVYCDPDEDPIALYSLDALKEAL